MPVPGGGGGQLKSWKVGLAEKGLLADSPSNIGWFPQSKKNQTWGGSGPGKNNHLKRIPTPADYAWNSFDERIKQGPIINPFLPDFCRPLQPST